jgi:hypothetical protein
MYDFILTFHNTKFYFCFIDYLSDEIKYIDLNTSFMSFIF